MLIVGLIMNNSKDVKQPINYTSFDSDDDCFDTSDHQLSFQFSSYFKIPLHKDKSEIK